MKILKKKAALHDSISKLMPIMQERQRITKPLIYAMHIHLEFLDKDSQYLRRASTFPREVKDLLDMALTYCPFKNARVLLYKNLIVTFFWNLWKERNQRAFTEKTQTYTKLFNNVAISWCKLSHTFASYSCISLIVNWSFVNIIDNICLFVNFKHQ